ncbi:glycosyltransferase family 1 protein (plasmid) [Azospirillum sp. TSA2s]|uniref:glycosyltransferase n=1 Tax=Azospirillum sp. TSA2s TaxID=709810 RepID=UPI0010A9AF47|nr:glycosyltransferase [Azospirillum sp. TSA2s]QCG93035.1 glycosyltransferase family 1 protein [Azospirillum sp. TSA2s]
MLSSDTAEPPFAGINILYSFHNDPRYMPPVRLSDQQVFCGPFFETKFENGRCVSLKTPFGMYDMAAIAAQLPPEQKPDLFLVKADASQFNFPRNVAALGCPTVLLVGDTQHMTNPIRTMVGYATSEPFNAIITDHGRRNLHFFAEAGLGNLHWMPGLNLNVYPVRPSYENYRYKLSHVGQVGKEHPVRAHLLRRLHDSGVPLVILRQSQEEAARVYTESQININCSLNGDVNLRVFEVLAHGGFLLSDRLKPQTGLELLFRDGEDLVTYDGERDLHDKVRYYMDHPDLCARIARQGHRTLHERHPPSWRWRQLHDLVFSGKSVAELAAAWDPRCTVSRSDPRMSLTERMAIYEFFQAINRVVVELLVLVWPGVDLQVLADMADLSRFKVARLLGPREAETGDFLDAAGVSAQVQAISPELASARPWSMLVLTAAELEANSPERLMALTRCGFIAVPDLPGVVDAARRQALEQCMASLGFTQASQDFPVFQRQASVGDEGAAS